MKIDDDRELPVEKGIFSKEEFLEVTDMIGREIKRAEEDSKESNNIEVENGW
jgi:hypothetical protein